MRHALVVGGSGMLANATLWLAESGYTVSVIGRSKSRLDRLANKHEQIIPISVDYYDISSFQSELRQSIQAYGRYDLVVAWIHSNDKQVLDMIVEEIEKGGGHKVDAWKLFHVLGSSSNLEEILRDLEPIQHCDYHQIQLGFVIEHNRSRWLTHEEISNGVIDCIRTNTKKYVVGTLSPWDKRP